MAEISTVRRIPTAADVSDPITMRAASLRPNGPNPVASTAGIEAGQQNLAQGISTLGQGIATAGQIVSNRQNTADVSAADANWLQSSLAIGQNYQNRGDFQNFAAGSAADTAKARDAAAALIRDPEVKQAWLDHTEQDRTRLVAAIEDHGTTLSHDADRSKLSDSITALAKTYSDPGTPQVTRDRARASIAASIDTAQGSGLVLPSEAAKLRDLGLTGADQDLAFNRARVDVRNNPQAALTAAAIPSASDATGSGIVTAASAANGGKLPDLDPSLAKVTANLLGDANFPTDPKEQKAYLSDPTTAAKYTTAAAAMLNDRYKGDLTAVAIALDPNGGTVLADKWVASGHKEWVLPPAVQKSYRATMQNYQPAVSTDPIPIQAAPGVDLAGSDPQVLDRFEQLQTKFGQAVPLIPASRDGEHNTAVGNADASQPLDGRSLELDTSNLSNDRKAQLIEMASSMGFTGIGVYGNSIHLDTGPLNAWGANGKAVPAWAKDAVDQHLSGAVKDVPLLFSSVAPQYAAMSFDQRLQIADAARQAIKEQGVNQQASLDTIVTNAPAAIANTGTYTGGDMPTATQFVQAWGAVDGLQKFHQFQSAVDTAKTMYGFRTESADSIMAQVAAAAPTSTGNDADLQTKRFDAISAAAQAQITARDKDPAGYVMQAFPTVADAFAASQQPNADPAAFGKALTLMSNAQTTLGIDRPQLLPKEIATKAAATFNDVTLPTDQRIGAIWSLISGTQDEKQQQTIYDQLQTAGVPEYTQGAVAALARGDAGGAANLMRAVMVDPAKLAGGLPNNVTDAQVSDAIETGIFSKNKIGDVVYGMTDGSAASMQRVQADSTLIDRGVKLHLIDGSAGGDVNKAVDLTIKDMYGDVQPVVSPGVKITLPRGQDPAPMQTGFTALQPKISDALKADMQAGMNIAMGKPADVRTSGMGAVVSMGIDNAVSQVMSEGYFTNAGTDQYQFVNPFTGAAVGGPDGKPLIFSRNDVLAAGATNQPANPNASYGRVR